MSVRRFFLFILLLVPARISAADAPRLAVVIVVDQLRADDLPILASSGPLARRFAGGVQFADVVHDHVPTTTAAGHAAISTGRPPSVNGIGGNDIYDRDRKKSASAVEDANKVVGPFRLKARTLADALRSSVTGARIVSISGKDRSSVLLGGQKPDAAVWYDGAKRRFVTSTYYAPAAPVWAENENRALEALFRDPATHYTPNDFPLTPAADRAVLALSTAAIAAERLGADAACDLLLVGFSATDLVGHRWGPDSPQMKRQLAALPAAIEELLSAASTASGGRMIAVITSDHGVMPVPERSTGRAAGARRVMKSDFDAGLESAMQAAFPAKGEKWILAAPVPDLYLNRDLARKQGRGWSGFLRDAAAALGQAPDVAAVYVPGDKSADPFAAVYRRSYVEGLSGDLQIRTQPGVLVHRWPTGTTHGTPYDDDALVPAVFLGTGARPKKVTRRVSVESLAPTLAEAMGIPFQAGDAPVLPEALPAAPARKKKG